ncbi:MAG: hypothetical protein K5877_06940 [Lachnospiraceae bacterium]|nr:hypothetical protein [Lachnospiraceae bacterium]
MKDRLKTIGVRLTEYLTVIKAAVVLALGMLCILPAMYITRFSYPAQDDFSYGLVARNLLDSGYSHLGLAAHMTSEWHKVWGGLYSSTFLGYFFSGYIMCDFHKIRLFEFGVTIIFFFALVFLSYVLACRIFKLRFVETATIFGFLTMFLFGVVYYGDYDVFYWFITSVQYLLLLSFSIFGICTYIVAMTCNRKVLKYLLVAISLLFGTVASGSNLSLTGMNVMLYIIAFMYYLLISKKNTKKDKIILFVPVFPVIGALINGLAPGNKVRAGGSKSLNDIYIALRSSVRFLLERIESYLHKPEFWIVLIGLILAILFIKRERGQLGFNIRYPLIFMILTPVFCVFVIFPAMLGYNYDVFCLLIRGQVLLDFALFTTLIINICVFSQWLWDKYVESISKIMVKDVTIALIAVMLGLCLQERDNNWRWIGVIRNYRDLGGDRFDTYAHYYMDILKQVEMSDEDLVILYVDEVEEKSSQINPMIVYDRCYDPDKDPANNAIAQFYGKKALWVLHNDYKPSEDDRILADKLGLKEWPKPNGESNE